MRNYNPHIIINHELILQKRQSSIAAFIVFSCSSRSSGSQHKKVGGEKYAPYLSFFMSYNLLHHELLHQFLPFGLQFYKVHTRRLAGHIQFLVEHTAFVAV